MNLKKGHPFGKVSDNFRRGYKQQLTRDMLGHTAVTISRVIRGPIGSRNRGIP